MCMHANVCITILLQDRSHLRSTVAAMPEPLPLYTISALYVPCVSWYLSWRQTVVLSCDHSGHSCWGPNLELLSGLCVPIGV